MTLKFIENGTITREYNEMNQVTKSRHMILKRAKQS